MLLSNDIVHQGLRDIFSNGTTMHRVPPQTAHADCYTRLWLLATVSSLANYPASYVATVANPAGGSLGRFPLPAGDILFTWIAPDARNVDWR